MSVFFRIAAATLLIAVASPANAADLIDPFLGKYEGKSIVQADDKQELSARDLAIKIEKDKRGFSVEWSTVIYRKKDRSEFRRFKIRFAASKRPGIYGAMMAANVFGRSVPHDPLEGDPYFWASIRGQSLFVYGIHVTEDGGYELQAYERTLKPGGLAVRFSRLRDGEKLREITGFVKRMK